MPLVEGIGDEVLQAFGLVLATVLGLLAWWSTNISDIPQIRTVLILGRRTQNEATNQETTVNNEQNQTLVGGGVGGGGNNENIDVSGGPSEEKAQVVEPSSSDTKLLPESEQQQEEDVTDKKVEEVSTNEGDQREEQAGEQQRPQSEQVVDGSHSAPSETQDSIRIKLKYLNDEQKLVEGKLQELLGDFKRRNFRGEFSRHQRVRLIFNGQVLQSDESTLQGCGLYDNCVVHCLVHAQNTSNINSSQAHVHSSPPDWNLGGVLYALLSIIFGVAWFFRYHYSHLFNILTTGTLVGLTLMFAGSVIGLYMPDQEVPQ